MLNDDDLQRLLDEVGAHAEASADRTEYEHFIDTIAHRVTDSAHHYMLAYAQSPNTAAWVRLHGAAAERGLYLLIQAYLRRDILGEK